MRAQWNKIAVLAVALAAAAFLFMPDARAQKTMCGHWNDVKTILLEKFAMKPTGGGGIIGKDGDALLTIFASPEGRAWAVVTLDRAGTACLLASGGDWQMGTLAPAPREERPA